MSKRITLTNKDIEIIIAALDELAKHGGINEPVYPQYFLATHQRMEQIKNKLSKPMEKNIEGAE